jgi:hypothetical protein
LNLSARLPVWAGLLLIIATIGMFAFTVGAAITTYTVVKPYVVTLAVSNSQLQVETLDFNTYYDPPTNRWNQVRVTVKNYDTAARSGTIYVYLYDSGGTQIASGTQGTGTIGGGSQADLTVTLSWNTGKTVADVASGRVTVAG